MRRCMMLSILALLSLLFATLIGGCGSSKREGANQTVSGAALVGSQTCINCHATTLATDVTGEDITAAWSNPANTHTTDGHVECESCHGAGGDHWGVGPIPFPDPGPAQCETCHTSFSSFNTTAHNNQNQIPNSTFSQFFPGSGTITVGQHIQECSVCHNASQRIALDTSGNITIPDPNNLPNPSVTCASCHDGHFAESKQAIAQRTSSVGYPNFRQFSLDPTTFAQVATGGTIVRGFIFQQNGAALPAAGVAPGTPVTPDYTKVVGTNNEVKPEHLCSACHSKGTYKNSGRTTHQVNAYIQWTNSGHGTRDDAAWAEFSANPPAYTNPDTGVTYPIGSHRTTYPIDMALTTFVTAGPANPSQNAGSNNFACFKCHNGLTSLAWQDNVQGTSAAPVVFGDSSVTCVTCHDPHTDVPGQTMNTRKPVLMTQYSSSSVKISGNVFLDTQPVPSTTGNATICIYCHQGRESGFTLYKTKLAPGKNPAGQFFNPHYLGTGAMLWGANAYEYTGKSYSFNTAHQGANCTTCHMDNPTTDNLNGGHTWDPNVATCNTTSCHGSTSLGAVAAQTGTASPDLGTYRASFDTNDYDGNGTLEPIAVEIQNLQTSLITLLANNGIFYSDLNYPYAFSDAAFTTPFTAWDRTPDGTAAYKAMFNLQYIIKGLPSAATSQTLVPNASAAVHDYKYIIQLLHDSYDDYNAVAPTPGPALGGVRPTGTRAAIVYGPGQ